MDGNRAIHAGDQSNVPAPHQLESPRSPSLLKLTGIEYPHPPPRAGIADPPGTPDPFNPRDVGVVDELRLA
jgi:hypothetical protein